jgi:hypothetical protein
MDEHAITTDLFPLLIRLADELDKQADTRRQRAIDAQGKYRIDNDEEVERWTVAFSTSYQTLRGVAAALRAVVEEQHDAASAPDSRSRGACVRDVKAGRV